ncbi:MAG: acyl-homoserine-lactone synthase [Rhodobacter sp.]|nr:acyl-homoserine-lactone synthase [Rhodobacter sp.]
MRNITFDLSSLHEHGSAFFNYLKLRKRFFVDQLQWDVPHNESYEMDQYDNPLAWYSLVVSNGAVLGGARVMATSSQWGNHSYMMRDASEGKLDSIPSDVMPSGVVSPYVWEMTRLVMSDGLVNPGDRRRCLQLICDGCIDIVQSQGCCELRAMSSLSMLRVLRQVGYPVDRVGEVWQDPSDGRRYSAMKMDIAQASHAIAAE